MRGFNGLVSRTRTVSFEVAAETDKVGCRAGSPLATLLLLFSVNFVLAIFQACARVSVYKHVITWISVGRWGRSGAVGVRCLDNKPLRTFPDNAHLWAIPDN